MSQLYKCKKCELEKPRKLRQYGYSRGGTDRYEDDQGRRWCGNICPQCHSRRVYENKLKRLKKQNTVS